MRYKIKHPMADTMSVVNGLGTYSDTNYSSEVAFFLKGEWVVSPIEPFADYHEGSGCGWDADTAVYAYVPNDLIEAFLEENKA